MGRIEEKLLGMGLALPTHLERTAGMIERAVLDGDLLFVSGQVPKTAEGTIAYFGKLGSDLDIKQGFEAAKLCALNCLGAVRLFVGTLDDVQRVLRVRGFVNSSPEFTDQPKVVNGASELLLELFGDDGKHARTAVGVAALPGNVAVEIDMLIRIKGKG